MAEIQCLTETLTAALEHMTHVEDMRRALRDLREGGRGATV
jgi:hypothetical protein